LVIRVALKSRKEPDQFSIILRDFNASFIYL
jgi:hypothetical protein